MNRPLLILAGGALLLLLAGVGGLALLSQRAGSLGDRLVREANTRFRAAWPRPSHAGSPTPGSFGQAMEPLVPELLRLHKSSDYDVLAKDKACQPLEQGTASYEDLPPACRQLLDSRRDVLLRILAATRAGTGGLPPGLNSFSDPRHPHQPNSVAALRNLLRFAALETRRRLSRGEASAAVDTCLDSLALSRELALDGGLRGVILSSAGHEQLYQPCAGALDAAPLERKRQALSQLGWLREGYPPLSQVFQDESLLIQLGYYGELLSEEQRLALVPEAQAIARSGLSLGVLPGPPSLARHHWSTTVKGFDALVAAADLPMDERRKAFARIDAALEQRWFEVPPENAGQLDKLADKAGRRRLLVDALRTLVEVDLARAEQGTWPTALSPQAALTLEPASPTEAHLKPGDPRLDGYTLRLTADTP
jgi:hypothetical protein